MAIPVVAGGGGAAALSMVLVRSLIRSLWDNFLPDWIRRGDDGSGGDDDGASADVDSGEEKDGRGDEDEMANLSAVLRKLDGLVRTGNDRLGSEKRTRRRRGVAQRFICDRQHRQRMMETQSSRSNDNGNDNNNDSNNSSSEGNDLDDDNNAITIQRRQHNVSPLEWHAALLAYWQLCNQLRVRHPAWRDDIYLNQCACKLNNMNSSSDSINNNDDDGVAAAATDAITPSQINELQTMLRYATWAYEPDDDNLRSYLQGGCGNRIVDEEKRRWMVIQDYGRNNDSDGFELLIHRTTNFVIDDDNVNGDIDVTTTTKKKSINNSKKKKRQRKPPGRVGYYVAISHTKQQLIIGMKGTSTLEDLLTDCCGKAVRVDLDNDPHWTLSSSEHNVLLFPSSSVVTMTEKQSLVQSLPEIEPSLTMEDHGVEAETNRSHKLRGVHEGILHCARVLLAEISSLIEEYAINQEYDVICVGHSLGGGTAILLAVLLRGKYPSTNKERVRAFAFAPPPVLDRSTSLACRHYVTSVVNNTDIVPRSSLTNLDAFLTILETISFCLSEMGMNPYANNSMSFASSIIALLRKLYEGVEGELILTPSEVHQLWEEAMADSSLGDGEIDDCYWDEEFGHHLFVPGRLLLMYESRSMTNEVPNEDLTLEADMSGFYTNASSKSETVDVPAFNAIWTDGTVLALRGFDIGAGGRLVIDHLTLSYQESFSKIICSSHD